MTTTTPRPTTTPGVLRDGWIKNVRARVNFDARSETEWGTLRSYIRLQASWNGVGDGPVAADQAYIQLGGLMMGYSESFWADSKNGGASNYGSHSWSGMYYGYQQRALIGYRFESNGFFGAISLEDDTLAGEGYMPDVVGKLGYTGGWGTVWLKAAYDESAEGFAAQLGAQFNIPNMPGSSLRLLGFYNDSDNAYERVGSAARTRSGQAEWSILAIVQPAVLRNPGRFGRRSSTSTTSTLPARTSARALTPGQLKRRLSGSRSRSSKSAAKSATPKSTVSTARSPASCASRATSDNRLTS